ncbi:hypothetical protein ACP70R_035901 [Stipagrostis hirtigluma subsp. patula]
MEAVQRHELVRQLRFPMGFRFAPTEDELVDVYLRRKIEGRELPLDVVNEVAILEWQPGQLVEAYKGYGEHKWYFFTVREPSVSKKEKEPNRKVRVPGVAATWKATGSVIAIRRRGKDGRPLDVVGTKRVLIYHSTDAEEDGKWSMHEYLLKDRAEIWQYALCSIQRKQHSDTEDKESMAAQPAEEKKKRKKKASTQPPAEKKKRKTKKTPSQPEGAHQQVSPVAPPPTPPGKDQRLPQLDQPVAAASDGEGLPAVPLQQAYPYPTSFLQCGGGDIATEFLLQPDIDPMLFYSQEQQLPPSLPWIPASMSPYGNAENAHYHYQQENHGVFGAPDQPLYTDQFLGQDLHGFSGNITQDSSSCSSSMGYGLPYGHQYQPYHHYQQEDMSAHYYSDQSLEQQGNGNGGVFGQEAGFVHGDQFSNTSVQDDDAVGPKLHGDGGDDVALSTAFDFVSSILHWDEPQVGSNQHELQRRCGEEEQQQGGSVHVCSGPSSGCAVCCP